MVDEAVREVVRCLPSGQTYRRNQSGTGKPYLWELAGALEALFQARRGPLLGHLTQVRRRGDRRHRLERGPPSSLCTLKKPVDPPPPLAGLLLWPTPERGHPLLPVATLLGGASG